MNWRKQDWRQQDWRKIKEPRRASHLCIRWFHWSSRPRLYWHYYEPRMGEMRYRGIFWWRG